MTKEHYLKVELDKRVQNDSTLFNFLEHAALDGLWYWDLEKPENEWMNSDFWELFGYDPNKKQHLASEWQDMIFPEDLERLSIHAINFEYIIFEIRQTVLEEDFE